MQKTLWFAKFFLWFISLSANSRASTNDQMHTHCSNCLSFWALENCQWKLHFEQIQMLFRRCPFKGLFPVHVLSSCFFMFRTHNVKLVGKILCFFVGSMWVHFPDDIITVHRRFVTLFPVRSFFMHSKHSISDLTLVYSAQSTHTRSPTHTQAFESKDCLISFVTFFFFLFRFGAL